MIICMEVLMLVSMHLHLNQSGDNLFLQEKSKIEKHIIEVVQKQ